MRDTNIKKQQMQQNKTQGKKRDDIYVNENNQSESSNSNSSYSSQENNINTLKNEEESNLKKLVDEVNQYHLSFEQEKYPNSPRFGDYYTIETILGQGAFGKVISAIQKSNKKKVAIKIIDKKQFKKIETLDKEAKILQLLDHPNIIKFFSAHESSKTLIIVMEYFDGISLDQFIKKRANNPFTNEEVREIIKQIMLAIQHMHTSEVLHRDLKPENILIREKNGTFQIRIIDFGLSFKNEQIGTVSDNCGTLIYMAPEVAFNRQYQRSVDIWSCGIIQYMLFTMGQHPLYLKSDDKKTFLNKLKNPKWTFPDNMNQEAKQFFLKTAAPIAEDRMSAVQCLKHVWISGEGHISDPVTINDMLLCFQKQQGFIRIIKGLLAVCSIKQFSIQKGYICKKQQLDSLNDQNKSEEQREEIQREKANSTVIQPQQRLSKIRRNCTFDDEVQLQWQGKNKNKSSFNYQSMVLKEKTHEHQILKKQNDSIDEETKNQQDQSSNDERDALNKNKKSVSIYVNSNLTTPNLKKGEKQTVFNYDESAESTPQKVGTKQSVFNYESIQEQQSEGVGGTNLSIKYNISQLTIQKQNFKTDNSSSPTINSQISKNSDSKGNSSPSILKKSNLFHQRKLTNKKGETVINTQLGNPSDYQLTSVADCIDSPTGANSNNGVSSIKNMINKQTNNIRTTQTITQEDQKFKRSNSSKFQNSNRRNSRSSINLQSIKSNGNSPSLKTLEIRAKRESNFNSVYQQTQNSSNDLNQSKTNVDINNNGENRLKQNSFEQNIEQRAVQLEQTNHLDQRSQQQNNGSSNLYKLNTLDQQEENIQTSNRFLEFQSNAAIKKQKEQFISQYFEIKPASELPQSSIIQRSQAKLNGRKSCNINETNSNFFQSNVNINNVNAINNNNNPNNINCNNNIPLNMISSVKNNIQTGTNDSSLKSLKGMKGFLSPRLSCPINKMTPIQIQQQDKSQVNSQQNGLPKNFTAANFNLKNKESIMELSRKSKASIKLSTQTKDLKCLSQQNSPQILQKTQICKEYLNIDDQIFKNERIPTQTSSCKKDTSQFKKRSSEQIHTPDYFKFNFNIQDQILLQEPTLVSSPQTKARLFSQISPVSLSPQDNQFKLPPINSSNSLANKSQSNSLYQNQNDVGSEQSPITALNLSINSYNSDQLPSTSNKVNCSSSSSLKIYDKLSNNSNAHHHQQPLKSQFYNCNNINHINNSTGCQNNTSSTCNNNINSAISPNKNINSAISPNNNNNIINNNNNNNNNNTLKKSPKLQFMQIK